MARQAGVSTGCITPAAPQIDCSPHGKATGYIVEFYLLAEETRWNEHGLVSAFQ